MIWWATQPGRALAEKDGVHALAARVDWLKIVDVRLQDIVRIRIDFEIKIGDHTTPLSLIYPELFPNTPSMVIPQDAKLLSGHQYGASGELCLEWRADNWQPDITGAMMIESAHRLLSSEQGNDAAEVESAHDITLGQRVRASRYRVLLDDELVAALVSLESGQRYPVIAMEHEYGDAWSATITRIGPEEEPIWSRAPLLKTGSVPFAGTLFRLGPDQVPPDALDKEALAALLGEGAEEWLAALKTNAYSIVMVMTDSMLRMWEVRDPLKKHSILNYRVVDVPSDATRLPEAAMVLAGKRVGIVGCGSVGSKVAVSLARSGVGSFVLIDSDVFFAHNLVRNELDRRAVGINKTDALKQAIEEINPSCVVETRGVLLGRQESAQAQAGAVSQLTQCDVIIDATADLRAFTICAAVSQAYRKPLVWGHIYEGGIGGLVARSRPELDPIPQAARRQIDGWFQQKGVPWISSPEGRDYETENDGNPLVASDAEVGIVAMHIARYATDAMSSAESVFPASAYVIGFSERWIFSGPFDTWPIDLVAQGQWGPVAEEEEREKNLNELIAQLLPETEAAE